MKNIKNSLIYCISAFVGLFTFVFFAIPYLTAFAEVWGHKGKENLNGYEIMNLWENGFCGVMVSLLQIFVLVCAVVLLAWGALGILKEFGIIKEFPIQIAGVEPKKLSFFALAAYVALNVLLLIFLIAFVIANTESGKYASAGFSLAAGEFITLVISGCAVAAPIVLDKYVFNKKEEAAEKAE